MNQNKHLNDVIANFRIFQEFDTTISKHNTLGMMGIKPGDTVHLIVRMCTMPTEFDEVVFDLFWGYPELGKDYLDACAWTFVGQGCENYVSFLRLDQYEGALVHSGDVIYDDRNQGHHKITVNVSKLPERITHVFFTLSAYRAASVSKFRSPSVKLYPAENPEVSLCDDTSYDKCHKQAIVMCYLERSDGIWSVHECGTSCDGYYHHVEPMLEAIQNIIDRLGEFPHVDLNISYSKITWMDDFFIVRDYCGVQPF